MLQQTRVETVIPYYENWLNHHPTLGSVVDAELDSLLKIWEGLGYYSRCRNFYSAVKKVQKEYGGVIPDDFVAFRSLPGVGEYIAGAVMSIAFEKPFVALDGNLSRVMFRILGIKRKSNRNKGRVKKHLTELVGITRPGDINQALMDLGSSLCRSKVAECAQCPLNISCKAFQSGNSLGYPEKTSVKQIPVKKIAAALFENENKILISKRPEQGLLGGLWELPNAEIGYGKSPEESLSANLHKQFGFEVKVGNNMGKINHAFTHFKMNVSLYRCSLGNTSISEPKAKWVSKAELQHYAFSKANHKLFGLMTKKNV
jgi:A/G-specific adenine glycosylase|tara:strand:+ start:3831 stop:4775 length:945 start_codon:yes stop_codon:yes gene_type:complete